MLPWIIQMSIISLVLIILVHYLFTFFKTNLTIPKVKDLVNKPQKQYDVLFDTMKEPVIQPTNSEPVDNSNMKNELKNYLKELSDSKKSTNSISNGQGQGQGPGQGQGQGQGQTTPNVNHMGGLLTNENLMGGSLSSSSYSSF
tara:strand:- start:520 stop:948 length:429 start_codon:yes stop_codon:yes gene_type:complete